MAWRARTTRRVSCCRDGADLDMRAELTRGPGPCASQCLTTACSGLRTMRATWRRRRPWRPTQPTIRQRRAAAASWWRSAAPWRRGGTSACRPACCRATAAAASPGPQRLPPPSHPSPTRGRRPPRRRTGSRACTIPTSRAHAWSPSARQPPVPRPAPRTASPLPRLGSWAACPGPGRPPRRPRWTSATCRRSSCSRGPRTARPACATSCATRAWAASKTRGCA